MARNFGGGAAALWMACSMVLIEADSVILILVFPAKLCCSSLFGQKPPNRVFRLAHTQTLTLVEHNNIPLKIYSFESDTTKSWTVRRSIYVCCRCFMCLFPARIHFTYLYCRRNESKECPHFTLSNCVTRLAQSQHSQTSTRTHWICMVFFWCAGIFWVETISNLLHVSLFKCLATIVAEVELLILIQHRIFAQKMRERERKKRKRCVVASFMLVDARVYDLTIIERENSWDFAFTLY